MVSPKSLLSTSSFRILPRWTSCVALETIHHRDNHVHTTCSFCLSLLLQVDMLLDAQQPVHRLHIHEEDRVRH